VILLRWFFWGVLRIVLRARYRLRVLGREQLASLQGPVLILPNHPGYIDPFLLFGALWPSLRMRPLVYSGTFKGLSGRFMVNLVNALEVPDLEVASVRARTETERSVNAITEGLGRGENFILWPAGRVWRIGAERVGPARATADILRGAPNTNVLLVRTRGVWGSSWTWAMLSARPKLISRILAGAGWILANLFFFMPRRQVDITLQVAERARLPEPRRDVLNPWLENWYNGDRDGRSEAPTWRPYHFLFGRTTFEFPVPDTAETEVDAGHVKQETREAVLHLVTDRLKRPLTEKEQHPETRFDQLGLDSLDRMDLSLQVERQFGFSGEEAAETIGQLLALAEGRARKKPSNPAPPAWTQAKPAADPLALRGETLATAFVEQVLARPKDVVVADDLAGALTGEKLLVGALIMSRRLKKVAAPNVGLLLPASAACDIALLAMHLAGKLPVVLNWTTGPANLAHAARTMALTHVLTSQTFADRAGVVVEGTTYLFMEELRKSVGKFELLRGLLRVRWFPGNVRRVVPPVSPDQPAVVLFTSGSEKAPKAVPLTHTNILTCQRAGIPVLGFTTRDVFLGFLPAFHSFGLSVTSLFPLLTGVRVVHHADPTDAVNLAHKITAYGVTVLVGTPTFVHYILERSARGDLAGLRLIVIGAEKCPPVLVERCRELAPNAKVVEGYGITECSPVVSVDLPSAPKPGSIGKPLPGVNVRIVDLDSGKPLPAQQIGMIQVSGPTVFPGYFGHEGPSPFVEDGNQRWYVTGDLGEFDSDGYLWFRGRLKRFLKAGGEMISLPALEEPFTRHYPPTKDGPRAAVEGVERNEGRHIVLFTTESLDLREANALLLKEGFHGVMRLDEVRRIDAVPVLGTGKIDYKQLRALIH
jgi:long-chain-fatty-acid--[acyl-carrier-protein] ligase